MGVTKSEQNNWLQKFEQHKVLYSYLALALYMLLKDRKSVV